MVDPGELPKLRRFKLGADGRPVAIQTAVDADSSNEPYEQVASSKFAERYMAPNQSSATVLSAAVNSKSADKVTPPTKRLDGQHLGTRGPAFARPSAADIAFREQLLVAPRALSDLMPEKPRRPWLILAAILSLLIIVGAVLAFVRPWQRNSAQVSGGTPSTAPGASTGRAPDRAGASTSAQGEASGGPAKWANDICAPLRDYAGLAHTSISEIDELTTKDVSKLLGIKSAAQSATTTLSNALKLVTSAAGSNVLAAAQTDLINATDKTNQVLSKPATEPTLMKTAIALPISTFKTTVSELPQTLKVAVAANDICQSVSV
ncbi:MAG: hypothetical protein ABI137_02280 [Antricoccus sp.]